MLVGAAVLLLAGAAAAQAAPGQTSLLSLSSAGVQGDADSVLPSVSADGRFVAFASLATNLVPEDTNFSSDIFVRDRLLGTTVRVSVSSRGREGDADSGFLNGMGGPSISGDGRFVAFDSESTNLVSGDRNGTQDVFVHDRLTGETTRVSVATGGEEAGGGFQPTISRDGRFVAFLSLASDLVPDDNFAADVFVHDRQTGVTERISQAPDGSDSNGQALFAPFLSADGRFVYFSSFASNLVAGDTSFGDLDAFLYDRQTQTMFAITSGRGSPTTFVTNHGTAHGISGDGRFLTFSTQDDGFITPDTNAFNEDAWLVDRVTGEYVLVGLNDAEVQGDENVFAGGVSDDGNIVALVTRSTNFGAPANFRENVYVRNRALGTTRIVSIANDGTFGDLESIEPAMTPSGQVVAFQSRASTFVPETQGFFANDIFVRDMSSAADLALTLTDSPDPVTERSLLTYTLSVANAGPGPANNVTLTDTLPDIPFVSVAASQGSCVRGGKGKSNGTLTCSLGTLVAGASATVTVVQEPSRAGTLSNTASVTASEPDPDLADNTDTETTTVLPR